MDFKKIVFIISFLTIFGFLFNFGILTTEAAGSYNLAVSVIGKGKVTGPDVNCGPNNSCLISYPPNASVTLTANTIPIVTSTEIWEFAGWSGACTGKNFNCTFIMNSNRSVTANFKRKQYTITVNMLIGSGTVEITNHFIAICTRLEEDINSIKCEENYNINEKLKLTVKPDIGWTFKGWGGDCYKKGKSLTCEITMDNHKSVNVSFESEKPRVTLTIYIDDGLGKVTGKVNNLSSPDGTICERGENETGVKKCEQKYDRDSSITLTAIPNKDKGWIFKGWGGDCYKKNSTRPYCTLNMNSVKFVHVFFQKNTYILEVIPFGFGKVTSNPFGIDCGTKIGPAEKIIKSENCKTEYSPGTMVTLTPWPDKNWMFQNWGGSTTPKKGEKYHCSEFGKNPCNLRMNSDKRLYPIFLPKVGISLTDIENELASISAAISRIAEQVKELLKINETGSR
ncbi:MAG: polymorphic outer membrane protein [Parcubacteria group bacterium Licking1014_1]|nr:MAG: polymorphic outer membrane protein [Parcubacteria group bacterium Licking1014_1]